MNDLLAVCLVALTAGATASIAAQPRQALRKGVHVEMPLSSHAVPMPEADQEAALIVSVTQSGKVYFGIEPISPAGLAEKVRGGLSDKLYIKADARTPYANVVNVLAAVRTAGFQAPKLLTAQQDAREPGTPVAPQGLEVLVGPPSPGAEAIVVQALHSGQSPPESTLRQLLQNRSGKLVLVKADGLLPFADVVHAIDVCRSTGAKVFLATPGR